MDRRRGVRASPVWRTARLQDPRPGGRQAAQSVTIWNAAIPTLREKMAKVLCVYRKAKLLKKAAAASRKKPSDAVAVIS